MQERTPKLDIASRQFRRLFPLEMKAGPPLPAIGGRNVVKINIAGALTRRMCLTPIYAILRYGERLCIHRSAFMALKTREASLQGGKVCRSFGTPSIAMADLQDRNFVWSKT